MNITKSTFRLLSGLLVISTAAFFTGCKEDEPQLAANDSQDVSSEAVSDSYFEDAEDLSATVALTDDADFGVRAEGLKGRDDRFACATITIKKQINDNPDTIIVDFGSGCTDSKGNVRKGKIIVIYDGSRLALESQIITKFDGFYVNGIKFEGTRTVTVWAIDSPNNTFITHLIELEGGKITWPDGTFAERDAQHLRKWVHNGTLTNRSDDQVILLAEGTAYGSNRNGREYVMAITEDIVFKASCFAQSKFLPVSGEKVLTVGDRVITVNYGEGDCDNSITVTIGNVSRTVTVNR